MLGHFFVSVMVHLMPFRLGYKVPKGGPECQAWETVVLCVDKTSLLGGSWVVLSGVISGITLVISGSFLIYSNSTPAAREPSSRFRV